MIKLTTSRLLVRSVRESDFEGIHVYASDAEVTRFMLWGPNTEQQTRDFIAHARSAAEADARTDWVFAIVQRDADRLIGTGGFGLASADRTEASLGYCLCREAWGQGYATEAAHAMVDYAFREIGMHRVFAMCHPENRAAARVMEKLGMRYEGRMREVRLVRGNWWDFLVYAVLEHEFR
jgi:[ribosomal protein S5]-alanine N-acetyltransferase